jgi:hypothetical protein
LSFLLGAIGDSVFGGSSLLGRNKGFVLSRYLESALLVFTGGIWIWWHQIALNVTRWYALPQDGHMNLTLAGYWFAFVSGPVFLFILLRWYMRITIWFWFLLRGFASQSSLTARASRPGWWTWIRG